MIKGTRNGDYADFSSEAIIGSLGGEAPAGLIAAIVSVGGAHAR